MRIHGLQKMTLLDYPGKVACTVFLGGCDLRCPFCHNSGLLHADAPPLMDSAELLEFLRKRTGLLDGVAFTGGEPLLRNDLPDLLREIRALGYPVKLDTNGGQPERLRRIVEAGLVDYVAMDVKNSFARYAETVGVSPLDTAPFAESIAYLLSDAVDYEFRTTVVQELHDEEAFHAIARQIEGAKRYFLQPFTDRDSVMVSGLHAPTDAQLQTYAGIVRPYVQSVALRGA